MAMVKHDKATLILGCTSLLLGLSAGALFDAGLSGLGMACAIFSFVTLIGVVAVNDAG
jgi:hypothetical protein